MALGRLFGFVGLGSLLLSLLLWLGAQGNLSEATYDELKVYQQSGNYRSSDTLTIVTYNLGYLSGMTNNQPVNTSRDLFENNLRKVKSLISGLDPDILGVQEIDFGSQRSYKMNQCELISSIHFNETYTSVNWDKKYVPFPYWPPSVHFGEMLSGQAVMSRFRVINSSTLRLQKPVNASMIYNYFYLDRLIQITDLQVGGETLRVLNVHLEAFDSETRLLQARVLKDLIVEFIDKMPLLIVGDFNSLPPCDSPGADAMQVLLENPDIHSAISQEEYLKDRESAFTFPSDHPAEMIDYILYNPTFIDKVEARVVQEADQISDHLPVLMKFTLRSQIEPG